MFELIYSALSPSGLSYTIEVDIGKYDKTIRVSAFHASDHGLQLFPKPAAKVYGNAHVEIIHIFDNLSQASIIVGVSSKMVAVHIDKGIFGPQNRVLVHNKCGNRLVLFEQKGIEFFLRYCRIRGCYDKADEKNNGDYAARHDKKKGCVPGREDARTK